MASDGEFQIILHWFEMNLFRLVTTIFSKVHGQTFGNDAQFASYNKMIQQFIPPSQLLQGYIETQRQSSAVPRIGLGLFAACICAC